jgi:hypothetical protein
MIYIGRFIHSLAVSTDACSHSIHFSREEEKKELRILLQISFFYRDLCFRFSILRPLSSCWSLPLPKLWPETPVMQTSREQLRLTALIYLGPGVSNTVS